MNMLKHPRKTKNHRNQANERGVALIAAILTLVLISAITAGMIVLSTTDTNISGNFRDEQRAYFAAKGGIEEVRDRLRKTTTPTTDSLKLAGLLPTTLPGGSNSVLYVLNPLNGETIAPWSSTSLYPDDEICNENTAITCSGGYPSGSGWYQSASSSSTYAASPVLDYKWVRITLKRSNQISTYYVNGNNSSTYNNYQACWNGTNEYADATVGCTSPNLPVYILTALAVTPNGSRRMIQTEIAEDRLNFQAPAALMADGTGDAFNPGASVQWGVDGTDHAGCGVTTTGTAVNAIGVPDNADQSTITTTINSLQGNGSRATNYPGVTSSPDVANVSSTMQSQFQSLSGLNTLLSTIKSAVTQPVMNCPAPLGCGNPANPGNLSTGDQEIIYVNGNLNLSGNVQGYGILVVTGTLNAVGSSGWNGIVLVVGQGNFVAAGTTVWNGSVLVAQTVNSLGQPLSQLSAGSVTVTVSGGGNGGINYSSGCILQASTLSTYHVMVLRELTY